MTGLTAHQTRGPDDGELPDLVRRFAQARVLVVGDIILDRYVSGNASRLSPEAPIPVLCSASRRITLGGAANVALNIATLGGRAALIGVVGRDEAGAETAGLLAATKGIEQGLVTAPGRPTTVKTRFMSGGHQLLRLDEETTEPLDSETAAALLARFKTALETADIVVLSDYAKGVLCDPVLQAVLAMTAACGCRVVADPKRPSFEAYRGVTVLTPNEHEVRAATRFDVDQDRDADLAGRAALAVTAAQAVLVTRSAKGLTLVQRDQPALHMPTRAREVADVSGAGDTLVATLALALGAGASLPDAAMLANITAGISVGKQGTATVSEHELLDALHIQNLVATDQKQATLAQAQERVALWRSRHLKIGFANGCFDLIHPGHIRLLAEARAACDRLVVALNTDASVKRLKGPTRPIQGERARATVMASLAPVDLVMLFDDETPLELIRALRPDVLVKGADYTIEQVVGGDLVQSWGGQVVLVDLQEGHSTTNTIRRMSAPAARSPVMD